MSVGAGQKLIDDTTNLEAGAVFSPDLVGGQIATHQRENRCYGKWMGEAGNQPGIVHPALRMQPRSKEAGIITSAATLDLYQLIIQKEQKSGSLAPLRHPFDQQRHLGEAN